MPIGASVGAAAIGAAGSLAGGLIQKSSTDRATDIQKQIYEQNRKDLEPFRTAGADASGQLTARLPELTSKINLDQAFLEGTPGYQFARRQGLKSVQSGAAARGLGRSGAAVKGATQFATGLADTTFGEQFSRELAQRDAAYNKLIGTANLGYNAAGTGTSAGTQTGQIIGGNTIGGGNALAAGIGGAANSVGNAANTIGGYNYMNKLLSQGYVPAGMYRSAA
jgi:hypothetical protein